MKPWNSGYQDCPVQKGILSTKVLDASRPSTEIVGEGVAVCVNATHQKTDAHFKVNINRSPIISPRGKSRSSDRFTGFTNLANNPRAATSKKISDKIRDIKVNLGISVKDVSRLIGVSRQTIYFYLDPENDATSTRGENIERINSIYEIAALAHRKLSKSPGPLLKKITNSNNQSAFDLMSDDAIDLGEISKLFEAIERHIDSVSSKMEESGNFDLSLKQLTRTI